MVRKPQALSDNSPGAAPLPSGWRPLADRMRPATLAEISGQTHLLGPNQPLSRLLSGELHSAILWGPPGSGKTTLARLLAANAGAQFIALSAVMAGVKDVRDAVALARARAGEPTVLFLDEVHRFNKAQQDAFLPFVEDGTLIFIGATTENPAFALNNALLSRARVYVLKPLTDQELLGVLQAAIRDTERGLGAQGITAGETELLDLARGADGDARRALNLLEIATGLAGSDQVLTPEIVATALTGSYRRFDRQGDVFYEQISALHKSVRGSDPDAALYWLARMLDGGCDPAYVARRIVRMASEDIGNADPRALNLALEAWQAFERLGMPEGELALAHAVVFLACAAKSNAVYTAWQAAQADVQAHGSLAVPPPLRPASTALARRLGHGRDYRYAHDEPDAFAAGESYFPDEMGQPVYYQPVPRGLEQRIAEKLADFRERNRAARQAKQRV